MSQTVESRQFDLLKNQYGKDDTQMLKILEEKGYKVANKSKILGNVANKQKAIEEQKANLKKETGQSFGATIKSMASNWLERTAANREAAKQAGFNVRGGSVVGGAIGEIPAFAGNTISAMTNNPFLEAGGVSQPIPEGAARLGEQAKQGFYEAAEIDPDALSTKIGEFGTQLVGSVYGGPKNISSLKGLAARGAMEGARYSAGTKGEIELKEVALGAAGEVGANLLFKGLSKVAAPLANKLQLSGLLNPKKLEYVANSLRETGDDVDNVANWMFDRGIKGTKNTIVSDLDEIAKLNKETIRSALKNTDIVVQDNSVGGALRILADTIGDPKSQKQINKLDSIKSMIAKHDNTGLSLLEVQKVKEDMDELLNIYTIAGDVRAGAEKSDLNALRQEIRKLIEDSVDNVDIKMLNRDIAVAKGLSKYINYKDKADAVREILSPFSSPFAGSIQGSLVGGITGEGGWEERLKAAVIGATIGGLAGSTAIKTNMASTINKIDNFLTALSKTEKKQLQEIVENNKKGPKEINKKVGILVDDIIDNGTTNPNNMGQLVANKLAPDNFSGPKVGTQSSNNPMQVRGLPGAVDNVKKITKLNTGDDIVLIRGTGGNGIGGGAGESLRGKGLYLTDNVDVARNYGKNIENVTIRNIDILDGSKPLGDSLAKKIENNLPEKMKNYLNMDGDMTYERLIRDIEGNTGLDAEDIAQKINDIIKDDYKGVKFSIGQVNDELAEKGLGNENAFVIREQGKGTKSLGAVDNVSDDLFKEARKYKTADEFMKGILRNGMEGYIPQKGEKILIKSEGSWREFDVEKITNKNYIGKRTFFDGSVADVKYPKNTPILKKDLIDMDESQLRKIREQANK